MFVSRLFAAACLLGFGLLVPAFAQEKAVKMEWKFRKDTPFYQEMETVTTQTMKVQGQEVKQTQEQTFWLEWTGQEPSKDNNLVVKQKIVGVDMKIDIGGVNISYKSGDDKQGECDAKMEHDHRRSRVHQLQPLHLGGHG